MNALKPVTLKDFIETAKNEQKLSFSNYEEFFEIQIKEASNYAIGPYFWIIGDNANMKITAASDNIGQFTPFEKDIWTNSSPQLLAENIHLDDRFYVLSALQLAIAKIEELPAERQSMVRVNIYARMLNAKNEHRWVLMQIPGLYINKATLSNCGVITFTDLSHLNFTTPPVMMTLTDKIDDQNNYYHIAANEMKLVNANLPNITKREQEVIRLMASGLKTPQIAEKLFISEITVEHHKKNLRVKTETKTSVELMSFVMKNNLI